MSFKLLGQLGTIGLAMAAVSANAATVWDESVDGDLSANPSAPTAVNFEMGSNEVIGSVTSPFDVRDYFTFTIEPGLSINSITLLRYEDIDGGPGNRGFHAIDAGPASVIPIGSTADDLLAGNHLDATSVGQDLLPSFATDPLVGSGLDSPIGPGTYTYLIQQTSPDLTNYSVEFSVVPLPAALPLLAAALGALGLIGRARRGRRPVAT